MFRPHPGPSSVKIDAYKTERQTLYCQFCRHLFSLMKVLDGVETCEKTISRFWLVWLPDHISMQEPSHAEVLHTGNYHIHQNARF